MSILKHIPLLEILVGELHKLKKDEINMYFKDIEIEDLGLDLNLEDFYAHKKGDDARETLFEHLKKTEYYFKFIIEQKNLDSIFENFEKEIMRDFSNFSKKLFREMILNSVYYHDLGKINLSFQKRVMNNEDIEIEDASDKKHSIYSAAIFLHYYMKEIILRVKDNREREELYTILALLSYCISAHHTSNAKIFITVTDILDSMHSWNENPNLYSVYKMRIDKDNDEFQRAERFIRDNTQTELATSIQLHFYEKIEPKKGSEKYSDEIMNYIIFLRFIYGLMVQADFYATADYMNGPVKDLGLIEDIEEFYKPYKESEVHKGIQQYRSYLDGELKESPFTENDINRLRSDIYLEAEKNMIEKFKSSNIFQLEAPTGSGKTNTSINLAFKCLEMDEKLNKIFYVFPFNNLVEQTYSTFKEIYSQNKEILGKIAVVNSITSPETIKKRNNQTGDEYKEEIIDYSKMLLDREFLHYPVTITTNIMLFKILFGTRKEDFFPLSLLANSVIILDEIHTYKNAVWTYIIKFLNKYSKLLNIKILIMSATLPDFRELLSEDISNVENLIDNPEKYYEDSLFKERVKYDFSLIDTRKEYKEDDEYIKILQEKLEKETKDNRKNVLFEFISKQQAIDFYIDCLKLKKEGKMYESKKIYLITGDDSRNDRENILNKIKKKDAENIILIATQCIEAGVDLDMDLGFKDISLLDSEEQFLGRINRSSRKDSGQVYFFHLTDIGKIYDNDTRADNMFVIKRDKNREILINKNFKKYYKRINRENDEKLNNTLSESGYSGFYSSAAKLDLKMISKIMTLIDDFESYTVFLARDIKVKGKIIDGEKIWKEYRDMLEARKYMDYSQWKIKLIDITTKLNLFTYQVYKLRKEQDYDDNLGNIYYYNKETSRKFFEEVEIENEKRLIFNRNKYLKS